MATKAVPYVSVQGGNCWIQVGVRSWTEVRQSGKSKPLHSHMCYTVVALGENHVF